MVELRRPVEPSWEEPVRLQEALDAHIPGLLARDSSAQAAVARELNTSTFAVIVGDARGVALQYLGHAGTEAALAVDMEQAVMAGQGASAWMSSTVLLALVQSGQLPPVEEPLPRANQLSLAQLLSSTHGLRSAGKCKDEIAGLADCAKDILKAGSVQEPGAAFQPSLAGLAVAGWVAEEASQSTWATLFEEFRQSWSLNRATRYAAEAGTMNMGDSLQSTRTPSLAGGLVCSPLEYARFLSALLGQDFLFNATMREEQWEDRTPSPVRSTSEHKQSPPHAKPTEQSKHTKRTKTTIKFLNADNAHM